MRELVGFSCDSNTHSPCSFEGPGFWKEVKNTYFLYLLLNTVLAVTLCDVTKGTTASTRLVTTPPARAT